MGAVDIHINGGDFGFSQKPGTNSCCSSDEVLSKGRGVSSVPPLPPLSGETGTVKKAIAARECLGWIKANMIDCYFLIGCGFASCAAPFIFQKLSLLAGLVSISVGVVFLKKAKGENIRLIGKYNLQ